MYVLNDQSKTKIIGNGLTRRILAHSEKLMPCELKLKKNTIIESHSHPHEQCSYVISGCCVFTVGEEQKMLQSGDSVFIPSGVPHKVEVVEDAMVIDIFSPMREEFL